MVSNQPECAKLLLAAGANANIANTVGERPYDIAVKFGRTQLGMIIEAATSEEGDKIVKVVEEDDSFAEDSAKEDSQGIIQQEEEIKEAKTIKEKGKLEDKEDEESDDEQEGPTNKVEDKQLQEEHGSRLLDKLAPPPESK